jgi:hypothetical protein
VLAITATAMATAAAALSRTAKRVLLRRIGRMRLSFFRRATADATVNQGRRFRNRADLARGYAELIGA